jgi:hypothetical protein
MNSALVGAQLETEVLVLAIRCRESHSGWQRETAGWKNGDQRAWRSGDESALHARCSLLERVPGRPRGTAPSFFPERRCSTARSPAVPRLIRCPGLAPAQTVAASARADAEKSLRGLCKKWPRGRLPRHEAWPLTLDSTHVAVGRDRIRASRHEYARQSRASLSSSGGAAIAHGRQHLWLHLRRRRSTAASPRSGRFAVPLPGRSFSLWRSVWPSPASLRSPS